MPSHTLRILVHFASALWLLSSAACIEKQKPFIPATPFAESFAPLEIISSAAEREGLSSSIYRGGGSCSKGSGGAAGGPTTTHVQCTGMVGFKSRQDAARLTQTIFEEVSQGAKAHAGPGGSYRSGSPEDDELHLGYCSEDPQGDGTGFQGCTFLHGYAIERSETPTSLKVFYYFTLDEVRIARPAPAQQAANVAEEP